MRTSPFIIPSSPRYHSRCRVQTTSYFTSITAAARLPRHFHSSSSLWAGDPLLCPDSTCQFTLNVSVDVSSFPANPEAPGDQGHVLFSVDPCTGCPQGQRHNRYPINKVLSKTKYQISSIWGDSKGRRYFLLSLALSENICAKYHSTKHSLNLNVKIDFLKHWLNAHE